MPSASRASTGSRRRAGIRRRRDRRAPRRHRRATRMPPAEQTEMPPGSRRFSTMSTRAPASCAAIAAMPPAIAEADDDDVEAPPHFVMAARSAARKPSTSSSIMASSISRPFSAVARRRIAAHAGARCNRARARVAAKIARPVEHRSRARQRMCRSPAPPWTSRRIPARSPASSTSRARRHGRRASARADPRSPLPSRADVGDGTRTPCRARMLRTAMLIGASVETPVLTMAMRGAPVAEKPVEDVLEHRDEGLGLEMLAAGIAQRRPDSSRNRSPARPAPAARRRRRRRGRAPEGNRSSAADGGRAPSRARRSE